MKKKKKKTFHRLRNKTTIFDKINSLDSLNNSIEDHKSYILKSRRFGYDGKNQYRINPAIESRLI